VSLKTLNDRGFMKYIIFVLLFFLFIALHGIYFLHESESYISALREKQYLWVVYFFASHILAEKILRRFNKKN
jgi:hypothetical protein